MRKVEKIVGTAFTRRKTTHDVAETPDEIESVLRKWGEGEFFDDPWAGHRRVVEVARQALVLEIAKKPKGYRFKEREDTGWYLKRLIIQGTAVQHHIDQGAAAWAAHEAALFGETFAELQLKLARERIFNSGKGLHDNGAASRSGRSRADRVAAIDALTTGPGKISKREAFKEVARLDLVTAKAVETDYYKAKKAS